MTEAAALAGSPFPSNLYAMATRDEVYAKFGITAEAAQLFETELGTLLLYVHGIQNGWDLIPDGKRAREILADIERNTLGGLISALKGRVGIDEHLASRFASALQARNRLNHGFYERHNFKIDTDEGRDEILANLEELHTELFNAWRVASTMTVLALQVLEAHQKGVTD